MRDCPDSGRGLDEVGHQPVEAEGGNLVAVNAAREETIGSTSSRLFSKGAEKAR